MFDAAVNHGPGRAIRFVQQVCNDAGFGPLTVDGACGPLTGRVAAEAERAMGDWLLAALVEERRNFYSRWSSATPGSGCSSTAGSIAWPSSTCRWKGWSPDGPHAQAREIAMGWLSMIPGLFGPAKELVEVFKPNAEHEAERGHAERLALSAQDLASLQQFAAEFQPRAKSTWWDSFIDGLNRLPRPLITLSVGAFFVLAPLDPLRFAQVARAYELMPDGFWALLSIIVAFYFGGRMRLKRQDMAVKGGALEGRRGGTGDPARGARARSGARRSARARRARRLRARHRRPCGRRCHRPSTPSRPAGHSNRVIEAWKAPARAAAQG